ncbi:MAG: hypothetical protein O9274_01495 [Limnobacter sp.]|uniref:hypothetical protein n=1 Tax=Limnobacter sp. TaxID=2003368 RepID=UPI0022CB7075|nr:hypothetical protein [Limnobacter sp.]MCZ8014346.1 hypothetical protein [Limnobacter sp.]
MNFVSKYTVVFLCIVLSGCAGMIRSVDQEQVESIRKVAVVSQLGNTFIGSLTATTVFGNKGYKVDASGWQVDRAITAAAVEAIQRGGRSALSLQSNAKLPELLKEATNNGADTLFLVTPAGYSNQPDFPPGYGFHRRVFLGIDRACIYSLFVTVAYDVKSGREIGQSWSFPKSEGAIPCEATAGIAWKDDFARYTKDERELIRKATIASVTTNIQTSVTGLGLTR